jgi:hypothetical protein
MRGTQRQCRKVETHFDEPRFPAEADEPGMPDFIGYSNYRDIEKQHYPAIARSEQDIVGPSEGTHQIYASLGSGRHRRRKGRSGRAAEIATGPVRIEACVADQFFDWKPESAQAPGLNVFKLRFGRVVRRADRRGGRRHGITDRDLAGPDARARST